MFLGKETGHLGRRFDCSDSALELYILGIHYFILYVLVLALYDLDDSVGLRCSGLSTTAA